MEVTEIRMSRFSLGATWIKSDGIRGTEHVRCLADEAREARLSQLWEVGRMLGMELAGRQEAYRETRGVEVLKGLDWGQVTG